MVLHRDDRAASCLYSLSLSLSSVRGSGNWLHVVELVVVVGVQRDPREDEKGESEEDGWWVPPRSLSLLAREREKGNREKKEGKEREERVRGEKRRAQAYYRSEKGSPQKVPSERGKLGRKQVSGCSGHFWDLLQVIFEIVVPYNAFSKACEARGNEKKTHTRFSAFAH